MKDTWESLFIKEAKAQVHSDDFVRECIKYATKLHANNMPVIFDFKHLASIFDVEAKYLFFLCKDVDQHYRTYAIKKKANPTEYRLLTAPDWNLKRIQLWILRNILIRDSSVSSHAHGFVKNRS